MKTYLLKGKLTANFIVEIMADDPEHAIMQIQDFGPYEWGAVADENYEFTEVKEIP